MDNQLCNIIITVNQIARTAMIKQLDRYLVMIILVNNASKPIWSKDVLLEYIQVVAIHGACNIVYDIVIQKV